MSFTNFLHSMKLSSRKSSATKLFQLTTLSCALALAGCGGGDGTVDSIAPAPDLGTVKEPTSPTEKEVKDVNIFISLNKNELKTGGDTTKATIQVIDKKGGVLSGVPVVITLEDAAKYGMALSGSSQQTTNQDGQIEVDVLQSKVGANAQINHETQLKASVISKADNKKVLSTQSIPLIVKGTHVDNAIASVSLIGNGENFSIEGTVLDANNEPVTNKDIVLYGNDTSVATGKTDDQGKFRFDANSSSLKTVNDNFSFDVELLGSEGVSQHITNIISIPTISSTTISFPRITDIPLGVRREVVINVPNANNGDTVYISTSKGKIYKTSNPADNNGNQLQAFTVNNNKVTFYIKSYAPGGATITAKYGEDTKQSNIEFISLIPSKILMQVEKSVLKVGETTSVIVRVLDEDDAPIKNALVAFTTTQDSSRGKLSKGLAYTDENGMATVNYTAGRNPTGSDGVVIESEVSYVRLPDGSQRAVNPLQAREALTVQTQSSYVGIGLADKVSSSDNNISYLRQGSIFVLDNTGQPVANQNVTLSLTPNTYSRGYFTIIEQQAPTKKTDNNGGEGNNTQAPQPKKEWVQREVECPGEDINQNSILDEGEDLNNNGKLDPINLVTILKGENAQDTNATQNTNTNGTKKVSFTTDSTGKVNFVIRYPKQYAQWYSATITVNTKVQGSEAQRSQLITFPILVDDVDLEQGIRPNPRSPFGTTLNCTSP